MSSMKKHVRGEGGILSCRHHWVTCVKFIVKGRLQGHEKTYQMERAKFVEFGGSGGGDTKSVTLCLLKTYFLRFTFYIYTQELHRTNREPIHIVTHLLTYSFTRSSIHQFIQPLNTLASWAVYRNPLIFLKSWWVSVALRERWLPSLDCCCSG